MDGNAIVLTNGYLDALEAKTAHGLIRGTERFNIVGVVDAQFAGQDAGSVTDGKHRGIPVFATVSEALEKVGANLRYCIVGVATHGGKLPQSLYSPIMEAIAAKVNIVNGLHQYLANIPEIAALAEKNGVEIKDIRKPRPNHELHFWTGKINEVTCPKIPVLGTDCALGKRTTARMLKEAAIRAGLKAEMIFTGQTGWLQGGKYGFIFDSTTNDFVCGEIEHWIVECFEKEKPDIIFIEGQAALRNPSGPCGSEFLVSAKADGVVLQHQPNRKYYDNEEELGEIPSVASEIALIGMYGVETLAMTLNTRGLSLADAKSYQQSYQQELGIPVGLPVEEGLDNILTHLRQKLGI